MTPVAEAPQITTDKRMPAAARTDLLAGHLGDRRNSLDLLRLFAASLSLSSDTPYAIVGRGTEPMVAWNGAIFSGGFALYIFFFLSGMLVTNSFRLKPDIVQWYTARALRIFPALCLCMVLTVFVLGPIATTLSTWLLSGKPATPGTISRVTCCCCGPDTSCPGCLEVRPSMARCGRSIWRRQALSVLRRVAFAIQGTAQGMADNGDRRSRHRRNSEATMGLRLRRER